MPKHFKTKRAKILLAVLFLLAYSAGTRWCAMPMVKYKVRSIFYHVNPERQRYDYAGLTIDMKFLFPGVLLVKASMEGCRSHTPGGQLFAAGNLCSDQGIYLWFIFGVVRLFSNDPDSYRYFPYPHCSPIGRTGSDKCPGEVVKLKPE